MKKQIIFVILSIVLHVSNASNVRVITDCFFPEEGNEEYVQLVCKSGNEIEQRDNCYSMLFEDDSQNDERSNVTKLVTSGCGRLSSILKNFTNLIELDISFGNGEHLTEKHFASSHLELFIASNINLTEIPAAFFVGMPNLAVLDLSFNNIKTIHNSTFNGANNLTTINLSNNKISEISIEIFSKLNKLNSLNVSQNVLKHFDLNDLAKNVQKLNLNGNDLTNLGNVEQLTFSKLILLGISNNRINCEYLEQLLGHLKFNESQFINDPRQQTHQYCFRDEEYAEQILKESENVEQKTEKFHDVKEIETQYQVFALYQSDPVPFVIICISVVVVTVAIGAFTKIKSFSIAWRCLTSNRSYHLIESDEIAANNGRNIQKINSKFI